MMDNRLHWVKDRTFYEAYNETDPVRLGYLVCERVGARNILTKGMYGSYQNIHRDEVIPLEVSL